MAVVIINQRRAIFRDAVVVGDDFVAAEVEVGVGQEALVPRERRHRVEMGEIRRGLNSPGGSNNI